MAQAQGGTAGSSVGRGNGSLSAGGGRSQGSQNAGKNDSRGVGGSLQAIADANSRTSSATPMDKLGNLMSGVKKTSVSPNDAASPDGSLNSMRNEQNMQKSYAKGYDKGFRNTTNAGVTSDIAGTVGGTVGGLVGAGITGINSLNNRDDSDSSMSKAMQAASAGQEAGGDYAGSIGLGEGAKNAVTGAASILGGPAAGAITGMGVAGYNYGARVNARPSAFANQGEGNYGNSAQGQGSGSVRDMIMGMLQGTNPLEGYTVTSVAPTTSSTPQSFQMAGDYSQQRNAGLQNLGNIINQGRQY